MKKFWRDIIIVMKREFFASCMKVQFIGFVVFFTGLTIFINATVYKRIVPDLLVIQPAIRELMVNTMLNRTVVFTGLVIAISLFRMFVIEKIDRSVETLVCYPISLSAILFGRIFAIWIIYVLSCYLVGIGLFTVICLTEGAILPISPATMVILGIMAPILGVCLFSAISMLYWVTRMGRMGNHLLFFILFVAYFMGVRPGADFNLWSTFWAYLIVAVICAGVALTLRAFFLNRERLIIQ